jgi:hypothetical protein
LRSNARRDKEEELAIFEGVSDLKEREVPPCGR